MQTRIERAQIIENLADGVIVFDAAGTVMDVNPAFEKLSRLSRRELVGQPGLTIARGIVDPADLDRVEHVFLEALNGHQIPSLSIHFTFDDGSSIPVVFSTSYVRDESTDNNSIITVVKDISDILRMEQSLRDSEEQFRSLADAMTQLVWIADADGNSIYHNRRLIEFSGREESTQAERLEHVHPDDRKGMDDKWKKAVSSSRNVLEEVYRLRRYDGVYRWFIGRTILIRDENHRIVRMYGTATDIDDLKKAEEALKENLEMLAMAERIGKIGSWKQAVPGNDIVLSDGVRRILSIPENEEISFEKVLKYIHPDDMVILNSKIKDILEKGTPFSEEYRLRLPDGSIKYILGNAEATCDRSGKPYLIHGSLQDITERKLAEEQIRRLLEEKELVLREVHHRIKNNMNTIMSLLALQANMTNEPAVVNALTDASNRMKSMGILYDKLYRMEGSQELSLRDYLPALVDEIIANFPNKNLVRVEKQIDDIVLPVKVLSPIGIIVNELITNAMKHAFAGRNDGLITVTASLKGTRATVIVRDNGSGMPANIDITTSPGFGLQLVGLLAGQLKGTMHIEREAGTRCVLEFSV